MNTLQRELFIGEGSFAAGEYANVSNGKIRGDRFCDNGDVKCAAICMREMRRRVSVPSVVWGLKNSNQCKKLWSWYVGSGGSVRSVIISIPATNRRNAVLSVE